MYFSILKLQNVVMERKLTLYYYKGSLSLQKLIVRYKQKLRRTLHKRRLASKETPSINVYIRNLCQPRGN